MQLERARTHLWAAADAVREALDTDRTGPLWPEQVTQVLVFLEAARLPLECGLYPFPKMIQRIRRQGA